MQLLGVGAPLDHVMPTLIGAGHRAPLAVAMFCLRCYPATNRVWIQMPPLGRMSNYKHVGFFAPNLRFFAASAVAKSVEYDCLWGCH